MFTTMTRARSICLALAFAVAPLLSSCSVKTLPAAAPVSGTVELAKKPTLSGAWTGTWSSGTGSSGKFSMRLIQKGKKFSGPVSIQVKTVTIKATIRGTVGKKGKLTLSVSISELGTGKGSATVNKTRTSMRGSITFTKLGAVSFSATKG